MGDVVSIFDYKRRKKKKKPKVTSQTDKGGPTHFPYSGKLGDAMRKYGSSTGNVMKDLFKKKETKDEDDDNVI